MRIVSLISSATETVCALGLKGSLVGISHECDYPPEIRSLPVVSEPKLNPNLSGGEIHKQVQDLVQRGLSIYQIKTDVLEALKPDLIITQDQCEVCAVSIRDVEKAVCDITKKDTAICTLKPGSLDDIHKDFRLVGKATGFTDAAEELVTRFWIQLNQVNARAGTSGKYRPKVLCLEWLDPLIVAGGWIPELVTLAGGDSLIVTGPEHFKKVSWEDAVTCNPDVVVILPCGYGIEKTLHELKSPHLREQLEKIPAVESGNCFVCDGNNYFNRPGPRIADTCEILGCLIHPEKFPDFRKKYEGTAYVRWKLR